MFLRLNSEAAKRQSVNPPIELKPGETPVQKPGCKCQTYDNVSSNKFNP